MTVSYLLERVIRAVTRGIRAAHEGHLHCALLVGGCGCAAAIDAGPVGRQGHGALARGRDDGAVVTAP